ncbi:MULTISPECIES: DUF5313 family protein [Saccharopolyspora]|uniref:DUF5313 family protein n=1 Tax=Saccharopolyspora TaxID=1835 RepID=UPI001CD7332B|nr:MULTISPECIES: DUF5313 family protein [Saccharopolyspora]MCA1190529.1 DUF5313 domain-containing protein [Saccharopolyspora sp. 6T]MCA1195259.1 DUF5313 domain-containing protein [Saccharopolyspora sp. 6V]MCA1282900.1 DUF5313 domain-containing protein [Saccharopolyspora sp. 7B]
MAIERPGPVRWLYYQYGGTLPPTYRDWVLRDATCSTWVLRVCLRGLLHVLPLIALLFGVLWWAGGSWPIALGSVLLGVLVVLRIVLTSSVESVDARLARHGFPPGHASAVRSQLDADAAARYRATWRGEHS